MREIFVTNFIFNNEERLIKFTYLDVISASVIISVMSVRISIIVLIIYVLNKFIMMLN